MNTKEGTGAGIEDSQKEKRTRYGLQSARRSLNLSGKNTSIIIRCYEMRINNLCVCVILVGNFDIPALP